jgi:hypothetical protein
MFWMTADHEEDIIDDEVSWEYVVSWATRLRDKATTATATRLSPGAYCGHCSSFDSCPAQGGALRRLADATGRLCSAGALGPVELGAAWRDLEAAERICATARAALLARVEAGAVATVDDGHALKLIRGSTSRVRTDIAAEVLGDRFYEAATVTVSQELEAVVGRRRDAGARGRGRRRGRAQGLHEGDREHGAHSAPSVSTSSPRAIQCASIASTSSGARRRGGSSPRFG